jgi:hypothetical protein
LTVSVDLVGRDGGGQAGHVRASRVGHIEQRLIRREGETVRLDAVGDHGGHIAGRGIDAVDVGGTDLADGLVAFVIAVYAVGRIGEPDRAVGFHHDIIGRVQLLAVPAVGQNRPRSVMFDAGDRAAAMFA